MTTHYPCDRCNMDEGSPICLRDGRCPAMADWWHLKGYGYAPGNYMNKCHRCKQVVIGLDKRAVTCRPCAEALDAERRPDDYEQEDQQAIFGDPRA